MIDEPATGSGRDRAGCRCRTRRAGGRRLGGADGPPRQPGGRRTIAPSAAATSIRRSESSALWSAVLVGRDRQDSPDPFAGRDRDHDLAGPGLGPGRGHARSVDGRGAGCLDRTGLARCERSRALPNRPSERGMSTSRDRPGATAARGWRRSSRSSWTVVDRKSPRSRMTATARRRAASSVSGSPAIRPSAAIVARSARCRSGWRSTGSSPRSLDRSGPVPVRRCPGGAPGPVRAPWQTARAPVRGRSRPPPETAGGRRPGSAGPRAG